MNEEAGFLSAICQAPADDTARLVYADWLDEQDDPTCQTKAKFIRLELRLLATPAQNLRDILWLNHLRKLATNIDPIWLAAIVRPATVDDRNAPNEQDRRLRIEWLVAPAIIQTHFGGCLRRFGGRVRRYGFWRPTPHRETNPATRFKRLNEKRTRHRRIERENWEELE